MAEQTTLQIQHVSKIFPGVKALNDINIEARGGEIVGLIGVNGAGKSTLMNILGGIHEPTEGQILIDGKPVRITTPQDAEKYGIGFIHQEPVMFDYMTVAENISVSRLHGLVNYKTLNSIARKYLAQMNCDIDPREKVINLPIGERQMVEIARALSAGNKILLFDEPTASFTDKEKAKLFEIIRDLKKQGACIFFISHFLDEVEELTDRTIVLRDGSVARGQLELCAVGPVFRHSHLRGKAARAHSPRPRENAASGEAVPAGQPPAGAFGLGLVPRAGSSGGRAVSFRPVWRRSCRQRAGAAVSA